MRLTQTNREVWRGWRNHSNVTAGCSHVFELHCSLKETEGTINNKKTYQTGSHSVVAVKGKTNEHLLYTSHEE